MKKLIEGSVMKKKLLVLLIAITPALIPSLAFACAGNGQPVGTSGCCPGTTDILGFCWNSGNTGKF
jgi:hypothetical protein